nr:zinc finger, CCHC-type [Tanacetum cinerariifolium]
PSTIATITTSSDAPIPPTTIPSTILKNLPTFDSVFRFDERLKSLETTFSEYRQTNPFVDVVSAIPGSIQRENDEFLCNIDENMKKIIKGQVKSQVKEQVLRILPRIEESVNATLEAEVLTRSSHSLRTSYAVAADLSEMELKKIRIEKMEGNKPIQRSDEQRNLYKALVEAYDADKTILDTYGESTILKRRREDDDQEGPSAGSDRGSKRRKEGGEHTSASTPSETAIGSVGRSTTGSQSRQMSASESALAEEPVQTTYQIEEPSHPVFETGVEGQPIVQTSQHPEWFSQPRRPPTPNRNWNKTLPAAQRNAQSWISELARQTDALSSFNELLDTPIDFYNFIMNRLGVNTLTPELLAGPTYELMRGHVFQRVEFRVEPQEDHTFEVEPHGNVDHVAGSQEVQTQYLIYYHSARDREQHSAWKLFSYREDNNEAAFAVAVVDKIYAHKSLTFNNTVACEVIFKWKAGLKDDMNARSDLYMLSNSCRKCNDDNDAEIWATKGLLDKAKRNVLGIKIVRDQSGNCDVDKNGKWSCIYAVGSQEYQVVCTRLDITSADEAEAMMLHMMTLLTTEAAYMTPTEAAKEAIWLKGLAIESGFELKIVAGIATGALSKAIPSSRFQQ